MTIDGAPSIGFQIEVIIEPDEDGFHAYCPALVGLHTDGATEEEALTNAKDAATAYLRSLIKHGDPIPVGVTIDSAEAGALSRTNQRHHHIRDLVVV